MNLVCDACFLSLKSRSTGFKAAFLTSSLCQPQSNVIMNHVLIQYASKYMPYNVLSEAIFGKRNSQ
ncbi:hypothetical protein O997_02135 [Anaplasma phagocytophilum str. MRK]|uniref:hypothetical protein n=1 Tax=Anaplasma phagocytophilum TaxID=948 RepID=UPI0005339EC9|nr:hypothetical protein [Anaplasma phagocytophilum]KDB56192.1 hypothetical protein O997_02135 [Anaplasma phagocytophilum str. MRK]